MKKFILELKFPKYTANILKIQEINFNLLQGFFLTEKKDVKQLIKGKCENFKIEPKRKSKQMCKREIKDEKEIKIESKRKLKQMCKREVKDEKEIKIEPKSKIKKFRYLKIKVFNLRN